MQAVIEERLIDHENIRKAGSKGEEPFVGFDDSAFGNRQYLVQYFFAIGNFTCAEEAAVAAEQSGCFRGARIQAAGLFRQDGFLKVAVSVDHEAAVADAADVRLRFEDRNDGAQLVFSPPVIAIEECNDLALALRNREIEGAGLTAVLFPKDAEAWFESAENFGSLVRGAVIHREDFDITHEEILFEDADNRLLDEFLVVVRVNQNA